MCRLNTKFRCAMTAHGYDVRSRTTSYGHREYTFTKVTGCSFTVHIPDCCPKCHQETDGIPWKLHSILQSCGIVRG